MLSPTPFLQQEWPTLSPVPVVRAGSSPVVVTQHITTPTDYAIPLLIVAEVLSPGNGAAVPTT